jgi:ABC-2 type transport system permease protein
MIGRILNLVRKEFLQISRDRVLIAFIVLAPVLQLSLLAQATSQGVRERPLAVLDLDRSRHSRQLIAQLKNTETLALCCLPEDDRAVRHLLDSGEAELAVIIPAGFASQLLDANAGPSIQLLADGTNNIVAVGVLSAAEGTISRFAAEVLAAAGSERPALPIDLRVAIRYNPALNARFYTIPAQVGFILYQVTLAVAAVGLAREREVGTLEQLVIAPLRRREIIAGKAMAPLLVGCFDFALLLTIAVVVFEVPMRGSLPLLGILTLLFVTAETAWGLMISTVARTQQQAVLIVFVQAMLDMTFSGYLVPVQSLPWLLRTVSNLVPMRHYLAVVRNIMLKGATAGVLWPHILALAGLGLALATMAALNLSRSLD